MLRLANPKVSLLQYVDVSGLWAASSEDANVFVDPKASPLLSIAGGTIFNACAEQGGDQVNFTDSRHCNGMTIMGGTFTLSGVVVRNNQGVGLQVGENVKGYAVTGCKFYGNSPSVELKGDGFAVTGNVFGADNARPGKSNSVSRGAEDVVANNVGLKSDDTEAGSSFTPRLGYYYTDLSSGPKNGAMLARVDEVAPLRWRRFEGNPTGIAPGIILGHDMEPGEGWDAGGQEGTHCLRVRGTIYCYTMGDRLGWKKTDQDGHGHAIGLVTSFDGVHFTHWSNNSNANCTALHAPFECCTGRGQGTCNAHRNPLIVANTSSPQSWDAGGGSCDNTRKFGCVGPPNVICKGSRSLCIFFRSLTSGLHRR